MSKLLAILTLLLFGCKTDKYELFKIRPNDRVVFLDLNEINDIRTFNKRFWTGDSADNEFSFIAKFDFKKGEFSSSSDKGIRIEGLPFLCLSHDCTNSNRLKLYLTDKYEILNNDLDRLSEQQTKDLIKRNILNYGKDPTLSDSPEKAVTEVFLNFDQEINKIGHAVKLIADGYLELIESKKLETRQTTEQLTREYPLTIYLRQKMFASDLTPIINEEEIPEEIVLDTVELRKHLKKK